jgi:hypothetical protein
VGVQDTSRDADQTRVVSPASAGTKDPPLNTQLSHDEEQYLLDEGEPLKVIIRDEPHLLTPAQPSRSRTHHSNQRTWPEGCASNGSPSIGEPHR